MVKAFFKPLADTRTVIEATLVPGEAALDTQNQRWVLKQPDGQFRIFSALIGVCRRRGTIAQLNTIPVFRSKLAGAQLRIEGIYVQSGWTINNDAITWDPVVAGYPLTVGMKYEVIYIPSGGESQVLVSAGASAAVSQASAEAVNVDATTGVVGVYPLATSAEVVAGAATTKVITAGAFGAAIAQKKSAHQIAGLTLLRAAQRTAVGTWNETGSAIYESFVSGASSIDGAASSPQVAIAGGVLKMPSTDQVAVDGVLGTIISDMTQNAAQAFDGVFTDIKTGSALKASTQTAFIGKNWGGTSRVVTGIFYAAPTNARIFDNAGQATFSAVLEGSQDGVIWTALGGPWTETNSVGLTVQRNIGEITHATAYNFHRVRFYGPASNMDFCISGLRFEERPSGNMAAVSTALTAGAQPETLFLAALVSLSEAGSVLADMTFEVTRDGGTTWRTVPVSVFFDGGLEVVVRGQVDFGGVPAGTSVKWRITRKNFLFAQVKALSLSWW